jgi:hypothetical protein
VIRSAFILLIGALVGLSCAEARPRHGGGSNAGFTFSYPPQANVIPINPGESSFSLVNTFGTFSWTNHQVEDPGGTPHEQYGMWDLLLTPAGGGTAQQLTLPNGLGAMSMAQDQNGTVYIEQGDANWYVFLGWTLTIVGSPEPIFTPPTAGQVPNVSGPFTPSADSMTPITAPVGTKTSVDGVWTWGAADTGGDFFLLLNGASTGVSAHTLTIESNGRAFANQAHTGSNKVFLGYSFGSSGAPTAGPIPIGIAFAPSYYSSNGSCVAASATCAPIVSRSGLGGSNVAGHLIATAMVTMSDGSGFAGTYSFFNNPPGSATAAFQVVGNQIQLSRPLTIADDSVTNGGPQEFFAWPVQNGVTMSAGWYLSNVNIGP